MSQFYSDLFSWTTFAAALGATILNGVDLPPAGAPEPEPADEPLLLASTDDAATTGLVRSAIRGGLARQREALDAIPRAAVEPVIFSTMSVEGRGAIRHWARGAKPAMPLGVVSGQQVNLRTGPGTGFGVLGGAIAGDKLQVTGLRDGVWYQVLLPLTEEEAWIHGSFFTPPALPDAAMN